MFNVEVKTMVTITKMIRMGLELPSEKKIQLDPIHHELVS